MKNLFLTNSTFSQSRLRLGLIIVLASSLNACSTATLIGANVDMASFVPAADRTKTVPIPALAATVFRPLEDKDGNPNNGFLISTPISGINIIEGFNADLLVSLASSNATAVKLQFFVAPETTLDVYQGQYAVASDDKTIAAGEAQDLSLKFDLQANANQSSTLTTIKSGKFRLGLSVALQSTTAGSVTISLKKALAGVSGYPAKLIAK